jgi:hypothetical protein
MTEDEAKTKWCPHAVASHTDPRQRVEDRFLHQCIGSACMAWREDAQMPAPQWVHPGVLATAWLGWQVTPTPPDHRGYVLIERPQGKTRGFCGLAGRP